MPTYEASPRFWRDYRRLTRIQQAAFLEAIQAFVADLKGGKLRKGLRVKLVQGTSGVFELTWAPDGRATFEYGRPVRGSQPHIVWRRCGTHRILDTP